MTNYVKAETPWEKERLGKFTASEIDKLFTNPSRKAARVAGHMSRSARSYIDSRAAEILTGFFRQVMLWSMEWGNQYEPVAARRLKEYFPYSEYHGKNRPLFLPYTEHSGGSPDVTDSYERMVSEIKCPVNPENHIRYCRLRNGEALKKESRRYYHQLQMNMLCFAKKEGLSFDLVNGLFASYCPIVKKGIADIHMVEVRPDLEFYEKIGPLIEWAEGQLVLVLQEMQFSRQPIVYTASAA